MIWPISHDPKWPIFKRPLTEAGHAIVAAVLGQEFGYVTIVPGEDSLGHFKCQEYIDFHPDEREDNEKDRLIIEENIKISFAGFIAEKNFQDATTGKVR